MAMWPYRSWKMTKKIIKSTVNANTRCRRVARATRMNQTTNSTKTPRV